MKVMGTRAQASTSSAGRRGELARRAGASLPRKAATRERDRRRNGNNGDRDSYDGIDRGQGRGGATKRVKTKRSEWE